ncbi:MAG: ROK family protein [Acidobacteria bacterium]|nr:ROK family protein [Acidobacteriota bacterium]MCA1641667.1 ROK family protein [Acidobacteriota bacterium]
MKTDGGATVLGIDVGGTKTAVVEGTRLGEILQKRTVPTESSLPFEEKLPQIKALLDETVAAAESAGRRATAISMALPGPLRIEEGVLIDPPNMPGWHGARVKDRIAEAYPTLPVFAEHDGNAGALAEFRFGAGRGRRDLRHFVFLTCGTGMGAGVIVNGQILRGASDTAGEVGHLRLSYEGPTLFGKEGSFEGFASGAGMVQLASRMFPRRWTPETPIREVVGAMLGDDPEALSVAEEAGKWLGRGMALLVDTLNPQMIALGSLAVALGERLLAPARRALAEEALPQAVRACEIVPAALGAGVGDVASLMAALDRSAAGVPPAA